LSEPALARPASQAITSAAAELGVRPIDLARRLGGGEIARLLQLLNAAHRHVSHAGLRHRIEAVLLSVTDGRMPGQSPESELDWALRVAKDRRDPGDEAPADAG
jgi:hypothetical protein